MTDGRFEATNSIRPNNWDQRLLWSERPQFQKLDPEIRYDESCPFHDLKADGCFQPEYGLMHDNDKQMTPNKLVKRPDGNRMHVGGPQPKNKGMGGYLIPLDTAAPRSQSAPKHAGKPWGTGGKIGLFSKPAYVPCPEDDKSGALNSSKGAGLPRAPFSNQVKLGAPVPYLPDDRRKGPNRAHWRLSAGTYKPSPLEPVLPALPPKSDPSPVEKEPTKRAPFRNPHNGGPFGRHPTHMPTPYTDCPDARRAGGPLFTYAAKSKRTPPIQVPWSTLPQTADPQRDYH